MIYLDTHIAVWLQGGQTNRLSRRALAAIHDHDLLLSPTVLLELGFMFELGRVDTPPAAVVASLHAEYGVALCDHSFPAVALAAVDLSWTRDPFDRLIVGHAVAAKRKLVTKDGPIRDNFADAIW